MCMTGYCCIYAGYVIVYQVVKLDPSPTLVEERHSSVASATVTDREPQFRLNKS